MVSGILSLRRMMPSLPGFYLTHISTLTQSATCSRIVESHTHMQIWDEHTG